MNDKPSLFTFYFELFTGLSFIKIDVPDFKGGRPLMLKRMRSITERVCLAAI
jgi:hypothetical protein